MSVFVFGQLQPLAQTRQDVCPTCFCCHSRAMQRVACKPMVGHKKWPAHHHTPPCQSASTVRTNVSGWSSCARAYVHRTFSYIRDSLECTLAVQQSEYIDHGPGFGCSHSHSHSIIPRTRAMSPALLLAVSNCCSSRTVIKSAKGGPYAKPISI